MAPNAEVAALRRRVLELEQAAGQPRRGQILLRTVIDNLPNPIYVKDLGSRKILANRAETVLMGFQTEAEALGKSDQEVYSKEVAAQFIADDQMVFRTGLPVLDREEFLVDAHGKRRWLLTSKLPLRDEHGHIIGLVGIGHDITARKQSDEELKLYREHLQALVADRTAALLEKNRQLESEIAERRRAEAALQQSEEKFSKLFHASPIAMCLVSLRDRRFIEVNRAYEEATGYAREEVIGRSPTDFPLWPDREKLEWVYNQTLAQGSCRDLEAGFRTKSGALRVGILSAELIEFASERCMLTAVLDITGRKQAEEALRESEEKYRLVVENMSAGVFQSTLSGSFIEVSQIAAQMAGYDTVEEAMRQTAASYYADPADRERLKAGLLRQGEVQNLEVRSVKKDGTQYWVSINAQLRRAKDGTPSRILGVVRDITERKEAEAELRNLSQQLLRSQDAERRRIALDLHDSTAQRLVGLLLSLSALGKKVPAADTEGAALLEECLLATKQSIAEIRTLSFLLHPPQLEHFGLLGAIRDFATEFARRSGIQVRITLPKSISGLTKAHEETLFRVLQEALTNIHRHSGSSTASIRLLRRKGEVRLEVQDSGCGLPKKMITGPQAETAQYGVGISGMRERLKFFHGRLELKSNQQGSLVVAILPIVQPAE